MADTARRWNRARSAILALLSIELAVLVVTGIALYFVYRPTATQAWGDLYELQTEAELPAGVLLSTRLRLAHGLAAYATFPTGLAAAISLAVGHRPPLTVPRGVVHAVVLGIIPPLAWYTGRLVAWDQIALWAVSVGTSVDGYQILFEDEVRFVIIRGVEVSPEMIIRWLAVHAALGTALAVAVVAAWRRVRTGRHAPTTADRRGTERLPDQRGAVTS